VETVTKRILANFWFDLGHPSSALIGAYWRFLKNSFQAKISGKPNLSSEIFFWEQAYHQYYVSGKHPDWWNANLTRNRYGKEMKKILDILSKEFNEKLRFIDVGSGPVTSYFDKLDINQWDIVTVDPLAQFYNRLNEKYKVNYPYKCVEGTGETLNTLFDNESYHLVLSQNAMDHATSPKIFMKNLYNILKPGGFLYLNGFAKEGEAAKWMGLHQHNLYVVGDHLFWTNRDKTVDNVNITENLPMKLYFKNVSGLNPGDKFTVVYRKIKRDA
jgi:SAM-dependent methyltransferase